MGARVLEDIVKRLMEKVELFRLDRVKMALFIALSISILPTFRIYPCIATWGTTWGNHWISRHLEFHSLITVLSHSFYWSPMIADASVHHACNPLFLFFLYPIYGFIIYFASSWLVYIIRANARAISKFMKPNKMKVGITLVGCFFSCLLIGYQLVRYEMYASEGISNFSPSQLSRYKLFEHLRSITNLLPLGLVFGPFSVISDISFAFFVQIANLLSLLVIDDPVMGHWGSLGLSFWDRSLHWIVYSSIFTIASWYPISCIINWIYSKLKTMNLALSLVILLSWYGLSLTPPIRSPLMIVLLPLLILIIIATIPSYFVLIHKITGMFARKRK